MSDLEFRITELERRLENVLRLGTVDQLDADGARVRVKSGELLTGWRPWLTRRAGADRDWWAPEPGEQILLLSPSGDPAQGLVLPALYQQAHPAPAAAASVRRIDFADGGFAQYERQSGKLTVEAKGAAVITVGGKATLIGKGTVEIIGKDGGAAKGTVQGDCLCAFTGQPHPHISPTVKESF